MGRRCLGISWDHQFRVYAVRLELDRSGGLRLLESRSETAGQLALGERLAALLGSLEVDEDELLAIGGYLPGSVISERWLPPLSGGDLDEAIRFDLASGFPAADSQLAFSYHVISAGERTRVRVLAVPHRQLSEIVRQLETSGVKADILTHPFMSMGSEFDKQDVYLPFVEPDCIFKAAGGDGLRQVQLLNSYTVAPTSTRLADLAPSLGLLGGEMPMSGAYPSATVLAAALLRNPSRRRIHRPLLSAGMHRQRFRRFRHNIIALSALTVVMTFVIFGKMWFQERDVIAETDEQIAQLQAQLAQVERSQEMLDRRQVLLRKFCENVNTDVEVMSFLYRLTNLLPNHMYVTNFSSTGNRMSATIIYTGERVALLDILSALQGYKVAEGTTYTQNADNKTSTAQVVWLRDPGVNK